VCVCMYSLGHECRCLSPLPLPLFSSLPSPLSPLPSPHPHDLPPQWFACSLGPARLPLGFSLGCWAAIDEDEYRCGVRREGLFYGFFAFFQKTAAALAYIIVNIVLGAQVGACFGREDDCRSAALDHTNRQCEDWRLGQLFFFSANTCRLSSEPVGLHPEMD